jgi:Flp pilus assembly pilin Flp
MLRNFLKNKKAQNTAEYALLIALVVAAVIAMQTYVQRRLQAGIHDASIYMANATTCSTLGLYGNTQYEPYYMQSNYDVNTQSVEYERQGQGLVGQDSESNRTRTGNQETTYQGEVNSE